MALTPCRECAKEVSDQAEICPNCGIRNPAGFSTSPVLTPIPATEILDETLLSFEGVLITRTLAKFDKQTFPINGIGSVTLAPPRRIGKIVFAILLLFIGTTSIANDGGGFAALIIFMGLYLLFWAAISKHGLVIKTASGDIRAMESDDKDTLGEVKSAIERAATIRG